MARRPAVVVPEAACEIKFGQVGIAQLKLRDDDAGPEGEVGHRDAPLSEKSGPVRRIRTPGVTRKR